MWRVEFGRRAEKQLAKLDQTARVHILKILKRAIDGDDPRATAEPLTGGWMGYWRYRAGDHRIIVRIEDERVTVYVIEVDHRRAIYR